MPAHVTFVRHAQTEANAAGAWQGATNTGFSPIGEAQLGRLARRFTGRDPSLVVTSSVERAAATAEVIASGAEPDDRWREPHVGEWEGLTYAEIRRRWPGELAAVMRGEDVALGGGERLSDVAVRLHEALDDLLARLGDDGEAIVVSHGLALLTLSATLLDVRRPAPMVLMENAGVTTFSFRESVPQLIAYNDASHLDTATDGTGALPLDAAPNQVRSRRDGTHIVFIRHGETDANVQGRWQGHRDWPLNETGRLQADVLGPAAPPLDALYASPLSRATGTAATVAAHQGHTVAIDERFKEIGFGRWENLTREEIQAMDPDAYARLRDGEDLSRGGTGETLRAVQERMEAAVGAVAASHEGGTAGIVSHGGATRAYLLHVLGVPFSERHRVRTLRNTAYGRIVIGRRGAMLAEWNTAPHLDMPDVLAARTRA